MEWTESKYVNLIFINLHSPPISLLLAMGPGWCSKTTQLVHEENIQSEEAELDGGG